MLILFAIFTALFTCLVFKLFRGFWKLQQLRIPDLRFTRYPVYIDMIYKLIKLGISTPEERFTIMADVCHQYPDMSKCWLGPNLIVFTNHPQRIQKVLLSPKCGDKWEMFYTFMHRENGLIAARTNLKWKEHRKFFNYCFSIPSIESFVPMFSECSDDLCAILDKQRQGIEFDFLPVSKKFSFNTLFTTSTDMKALDVFDQTSLEKIYDSFEMLEKCLNYKIEIPFIYPHTIFKISKLGFEERKATKVLENFRDKIIDKRRSVMNANSNNNDQKNNGGTILIDHIIRNEDSFTNKEILDHVVTFIGGYETIANAFAHVMLLIAMHPTVQETLYETIERSILSDNDTSKSALINSLQYLEFVLRESYRLMPTVPLVLREVTDDFEIDSDLVIPKGVNICINFFALQRRKDIWGDDSNEFKPERFASENSDNRHIFSFLPFSAGPRICIANKYSNIAIKIAIVKLLRKFKFTTTMQMQDIRLKSYISLKLCTEHLISVEKRVKKG